MEQGLQLAGCGEYGLLMPHEEDFTDRACFGPAPPVEFAVRGAGIGGQYLCLVDEQNDVYLVGNRLLRYGCMEYLRVPRLLLQRVNALSCGWEHVVFRSSLHIHYGMGSNLHGQLGFGKDVKAIEIPSEIKLKFKPNLFFCGVGRTLFAQDRVIFGCGLSKHYELGDKGVFHYLTLVGEVKPGVKKIVGGLKFSMVLLEDGELLA
jgi:hypothetical protein